MITLILILCGSAVFSVVAVKKGIVNLPYAQLLAFQRAKAESIKATDILFIGDSSLGNAVDVTLCASEYDLDCTSLALTGAFGYGGSLGILERALERTTPKAVVVFHTLDMMSRDVSTKAYSLISPKKTSALFSRFEDTVSTLWNYNYVAAIFKYGFTAPVPSEEMIAYDYPRPNEDWSLTPEPSIPQWQPQINIGKLKYLNEIIAVCKEKGIPLLYVHGPLSAPYYRASRKFQPIADSAIRSTGINMPGNTPIMIPWKEIGDSEDHVNPAFRKKYTRLYLDIILAVPSMQRALSPMKR